MLRYVFSESRRLAVRGRCWVVVVFAVAASVYELLGLRAELLGEMNLRVGGALGLGLSSGEYVLQVFIPLIAGVVSAGALAEDRAQGRTALVMARGLSCAQYLLARAVSMALAAAGATVVTCGAVLVISALVLPWGGSTTLDFVGPVPAVFRVEPFMSDLITVLFLGIGAAGLAMTGVLVGVLVANEYVAAAVPLLVVGFALFVFDSPPLAWVSPFTYVELGREYPVQVPEVLLFVAAPLYWALFAVVVVALALAVFRGRELV
jgi:hypothetical protein